MLFQLSSRRAAFIIERLWLKFISNSSPYVMNPHCCLSHYIMSTTIISFEDNWRLMTLSVDCTHLMNWMISFLIKSVIPEAMTWHLRENIWRTWSLKGVPSVVVIALGNRISDPGSYLGQACFAFRLMQKSWRKSINLSFFFCCYRDIVGERSFSFVR